MSEFGVVTGPGTVKMERLLPGPIERVWEYLTDPAKRATWLAGGPMELWVGGKVELQFHHADLSSPPVPFPERFRKLENGHTVIGRVTQCEPPNLLSYTWGEGKESEVTFALTPRDGKVLLTMTHRRLANRSEMVSVAGGWHAHAAVLAARLAGVNPGSFWAIFDAVEGEYETRFPAGAEGAQ